MARKQKTKAKSRSRAKTRVATNARVYNRHKSPSFAQRAIVFFSGAILILCAASMTYGFFIRNNQSEDPGARFRVQILNGTGKPGLAHTVKRGLLRMGIDVIEADNADHFDYTESVIIARRRDVDVEALAAALGCRNVIEQLKDDALEDATLILGHDYESLKLELDE